MVDATGSRFRRHISHTERFRMKLLDLFRSANSEEKALDDNPYLNARRTLNEYNGALIQSRHMWQAAALLALTVAAAVTS